MGVKTMLVSRYKMSMINIVLCYRRLSDLPRGTSIVFRLGGPGVRPLPTSRGGLP